MTPQLIIAAAVGVTFLLILLGIGCFIAFRPNDKKVPDEAMMIFRVILAIAAAGFGAVIPGFLEINGTVATWLTIRAAGSLALFCIIYFINPPLFVEKRVHKPDPITVIKVPKERRI